MGFNWVFKGLNSGFKGLKRKIATANMCVASDL
jgi:hypothetical protein